jgi:hypothetical protein
MKLQRNQSLKMNESQKQKNDIKLQSHQYVKIKSWNHDYQNHELSSLDEQTQKKKDQT